MDVVYEDRFTRIVDYGNYWVVEDKTKLGKPVVESQHVFQETNVVVDTVLVESSSSKLIAVVRYYYPKDDFEYKYVLDVARRLSGNYQKQIDRLGGGYV